MGKPSTTAIGNVTLGRSVFRLLPWNVLSGSSGIWVRFTGPNAVVITEKVAQTYQRRLEEKLSALGELIWRPSDAKGSIVSVRRDSTLSEPETWQELNEWMAQALETTYELFSKIVSILDEERVVPDALSDVQSKTDR